MDRMKPNIYRFPDSKRERKKIRRAKLSHRHRLLYRLCWLCRTCFVLLLTAFLLIHYNLFTGDSLQRIAAYVRVGTNATASDMRSLTFPEIADSVLPFGNGLVVAGLGELSVCMPGGITQLNYSLNYSDLSVDTSPQTILVYNKNGTDLTLANSASVLSTLKLKFPILYACMGESNNFAVITSEPGYRATVTVYKDKKSQMYKWSSSEYYIMSVALSPDGKRMAAVCFTTKGARIVSRLLFFDLDNNQIQKKVELGDSMPIRLNYLDENTAAVLCDNELLVVNQRGKIFAKKTFDSSNLLAYDTTKNQAVLGLKSYSQSTRSDLYLIYNNGKICGPLKLTEDLKTVSVNQNRCAVMTTNTVTVYNHKLEEIYHYKNIGNAQNIILKEDGSFYLVYAKCAKILSHTDAVGNSSSSVIP